MLISFLRIAKSGLANQRNTAALLKELNGVLSAKGLSLSKKQINRLSSYTWQSAMTNLWFSTLRGKKPTREEVQLGLWVGAFAPLIDDMMDDNNWTFDQVLNAPPLNSPASVVFHYLNDKMQSYFEERPGFKRYFDEAIAAQNRSLVQVQSELLSREELQRINVDKGGFSTLWFRTILNNELREGEEQALFTLGSTLQLLNDIYDLHKDVVNGTQSIVNLNPDMRVVEVMYDELWRRFKAQYRYTPYPRKNIEKSIKVIAGVTATGYVALQRFKRIQGENEQIDVPSFERKALIVDMEKLPNLLLNWKLARKISQ